MDEVRAANQAFYRAFSSLDLERMEDVWAHDGEVSCVHPGWPVAEGWPAVRRSWETIFRNASAMQVVADEERIDARGDLAWVVCRERIHGQGGQGAALATNVFRRDHDGRWRLVHHHGSPYVPPSSARSVPERGERRREGPAPNKLPN